MNEGQKASGEPRNSARRGRQEVPVSSGRCEADQRAVRRTVVLGIGNPLLTDEGVGIHVINRLGLQFGPDADVDCVDGGTLSFSLAATIEDARRLIVVDAAELGAAPGTVRVFEGAEMDAFLGSNRKRSVHEVGLLDLMAVALLSGRLPQRRALVAIQPGVVEWGEQPSEAVAQAVPVACAAARDLAERWRAHDPTGEHRLATTRDEEP
jgi:hydrogenase maturation protease